MFLDPPSPNEQEPYINQTRSIHPPPTLEIACFNIQSAITAFQADASRIELCRNKAVGGLTPTDEDFISLKSQISIPIYVMIRPHGDHFEYTRSEFEEMGREIERFKEEGADGFVFGILKEGLIDEVRCKILIEKAGGKPCTFHRAFDEIPKVEMWSQLEILIQCGFKNLLTSGGEKTAWEGRIVLKELLRRAKERITVIVGGGIRFGDISRLTMSSEGNVKAKSFHSSAITSKNNDCEDADREEIEGILSQMRIHVEVV